MAYEDLIRAMEVSAAAKNRDTLEKANQDAERIISDARERAVQIKERYLNECLLSVEKEQNRLSYLTQGENQTKITHVRNDLFDASFRLAEEELTDLRNSPDYPAFFMDLVSEAIEGINDPVLHIDPRDDILCKKILEKLGISARIIPDIRSPGGLVVSGSEGKVTVNNTIESRIKRAREVYRLSIYQLLAGG